MFSPKTGVLMSLARITFILITLFFSDQFLTAQNCDKDWVVGSGVQGSPSATVYAIEERGDGSYYVCGEFEQANGQSRFNMAAFNPDGSIRSFNLTGVDGPTIVAIYDIAVQKDNKVILVGRFNFTSGPLTFTNIVRLNPNGTIDTDFRPTVFSSLNSWEIRSVEIQSDDQIIIAGNLEAVNSKANGLVARNGIARLLVDNGDLDESFDPQAGIVVSKGEIIYDVELNKDDEVIVVGDFPDFNNGGFTNIAKLRQDGTLGSFDKLFYDAPIFCVELLDDNSMYVGGLFTEIDGERIPLMVKLDQLGRVDPSFEMGSGFDGKFVGSIDTYENGLVLAGGDFGSYNKVEHVNIIAIRPDGKDLGLDGGDGPDGAVHKVFAVKDGNTENFYMGGSFEQFNCIDAPAIKLMELADFQGPTINMSTSVAGTVCEGQLINVAWNVTSSDFCSNNTFRYELSNASGNFANPILLGSLQTDKSSSMEAPVPSGLSYGTNYRIRIASTNPPSESNVSSTFTIEPSNPNWTLTGPTTICPDEDDVQFSATDVSGASFSWNFPNTAVIDGSDSTYDVEFDFNNFNGPATIAVQVSTACNFETLTAPLDNFPNPAYSAGTPMTGATVLCENDNEAYSVPALTNVTNYVWSVDPPASITSGQGTRFISVDWTGSSGGSLNITGFNACGESGNTIKNSITVNPIPSQSEILSPTEDTVYLCDEKEINLKSSAPGSGEVGSWRPLGLDDISSNTSLTVPLTSGLQGYSWLHRDPSSGCATYDTVVIIHSLADAGGDYNWCKFMTSTDASGSTVDAPYETGEWSVLSGTATFLLPTFPNSPIFSGSGFRSVVQWEVTNDGCTSTDQAIVWFDSDNDIGPDATICGDEFQLSALALSPSSTGQWTALSGPGIFDDDNSISATVSDLDPGNNILRWTVTNSACNLTVTDDITVVSDPAIVPFASVVNNNPEICDGQQGDFDLDDYYSTYGAPEFLWYVNSTPVSGATGLNFQASGLSDGDEVQVRIIQNYSCSSNDTVFSAPESVKVNPNLTPAVDLNIFGSTTICSGDLVSFSTSATNGGTSPTYLWYINGVPLTGVTGQSHETASIQDGDQVYVEMTSSSEICTGTPVVQSSIITFTVNDIPTSTNPIIGNSQPCIGGTESYMTTTVSGAQDYRWTLPSGASLLSDTSGFNTTSVDVDFGSAVSGTVRVRAINNCGVGPVEGVVLDFQDVPSGAVSITGVGVVCVGSSNPISTSTLPDATSYFWTVPTGFSIGGGQNSSSIITSAITPTIGSVSVTPRNVCGNGLTVNSSIESMEAPTETGVITGLQTICEGATESYSTSMIAGATSYQWSLPPDAFTLSQSENASVTFDDQSGDVSVAGVNMCGTGPFTDHAITVNLEPNNAGAITGEVSVCSGTSGLIYSITNVPNTTNYQWDITGATIVGGAGTSSITVNASTTSFSLQVTPENSCGEGNSSSLNVSVETVPGIGVGGNGNPNCMATSETYVVSPSSVGSVYSWTVPNGATLSGQGSSSISVDFGTSNGFITVQETTASGCVGSTEDFQVSLTGCALSADFQVSDDTVCVGDPITISNLSTGTSLSSIYSWSFGVDASPLTSTLENPGSISYGSAGSKEISLMVTDGVSDEKILSDAVIVFDFPSSPTIVGVDTVCSGESGVIFSVDTPNLGSTYSWSVPSGASITSGQGTANVTIDFGGTPGAVTVIETNQGGCQSSQTNYAVALRNTPSPAGSILGPIGPCETDTVTYQINLASGASSYSWVLPTGTAIVGATSGESIQVVVGAISGSVQVTPENVCGSGASSTRNITPSNVPSAAGVISGLDSICSSVANQSFSIPTVVGATGYTWSIPSGSAIANGSNTNSVSIDFGAQEGVIQVVPFNACGNALSSSIDINFIPLPTASGIVGQNQVCENELGIAYEVQDAEDYSSLVWMVPSGSILNNQGGESITIDFGVAGGDVSIAVSNICGEVNETLNVAVTGSVIPTTSISSIKDTVCAGESNVYVANSSGGGQSPLFEWYGDGAIIQASGVMDSLSVDDATFYSEIKVQMTSSITCTTDPIALDSIEVMSHPGVGSISDLDGPSDFCLSGTVNYSLKPATNAIGLIWDLPTDWVINSGVGTNNINVSAMNVGTSLIVVSAYGICDTSTSLSMSVDVSDVPAIEGIGGPDTVCANLTGVVYNAFGVSGVVDSITWTAQDAIQSTKNTFGDQLTVDFGSSPVQLTVTAYNLCGTSIPVNSTAHIGTSFGVPVTVVPATTFCEGDTAEIALNGFGDSFDKTWYKDGVELLLSDKDTILSVIESGEYQVDVTSNGCSGQSALVSMTTTSINQVSLGFDTLICSTSGVLTATAVGDVYSWDLEGVLVSSGSVNTLIVDESGVYNVTATNTFGCSSSAEIEVLVNPKLSPLAGDVTIFHADNLNLSLVLSEELSEADSITVQLLGAPVHGQLDENLLKNNYILDYQPNVQFSGKDKVTYIISNKCGITDTVDVTINVRPKAIVGTTDISTSGVVKLSWATLLENDEGTILAATVTITKIASGAEYSVEGENIEIDYSDIDYSEEFDTLYYIFVDSDGLESEESYQLLKLSNPEVTQTHEPDGRITIYNAVSANGDDIQPYFSIPAFDPVAGEEELYPTAKVIIWNSWGDEVFSSTNYGLGQEVWDAGFESGNLLPEGTYYYSVQLASEPKPSRKGYLIVKH